MTAVENHSIRLPWLDWMKVIAMYFIIAGHCWVPGNKYIYVFSVPCFFIISGFLSHREENGKVFWKKLFYNMVLPMLILLVLGLAFHNLQMYVNHDFHWSYLWKGFLLAFAGMQGQNYPAGGLQALWFVYTLCLCKIILQYTPRNKEKLISLILIFLGLAGACILSSRDVELYNAYADVLLAYPFYYIGYLFRHFKLSINTASGKVLVPMAFISSVIVYICGRYNDPVMLYRCSYGSSLTLCLIGGLAGTCFVYIVSKYAAQLFNKLNISILGGGTIVILGLHYIIIVVCNNIYRLSGVSLYVLSLAILLAFIPINQIVKKYIPILWGRYRK